MTLRRRLRRRLLTKIRSRTGILITLLLINCCTLAVVAAAGAGWITLLGLTPLVALPLLGALSWWLTWKEFHQ